MRKHFSRALAALLVLAMVLTMLPATALAVESGDSATFINGLPADGSYGVLYNIDGYVMGFDLADGKAPAKAATADNSGIKSLPDGTAVVKFIKTGSDYFLTLGGKYLTVKDIGSAKEQMVLTDQVETGSKWTIMDDQAGKAGWYNIKNAEYKYNGSADVYLEQYRGSQISPYSYYKTDKTGADQTNLYQFKIASTAADEDGRVGEIVAAGALPVNGKYVIYNRYARAVFGQPTGADVAAPALLAAAAKVKSNDTLAYEDIADGGLIFNVTVDNSGAEPIYTFENNGKYLAMPENTTDENGKVNNDETLLLIEKPEDEKLGYIQWTLTEIAGGYVMYNVAANYGGSRCCVEFFDDVFSGWTFKSGTPELFSMNFYPMQDKDGQGYVVNPSVELKKPDPAIGSDCAVEFTIRDVSEPTEITASYRVDSKAFQNVAPTMEIRKGSFTVPAAALEGGKKLTIRIAVTDALGKSYSADLTVDIRDEPLILTNLPAANSATGDQTRPEIAVTYANVGEGARFEMLLDETKVDAAAAEGKLSYTPASELAQGKHTVAVTITRADGKSVNKTWNFFVGEGGETLYFGQIHAHTAEYSDGAGTLEDAYEHAQGVDDMDFIIVTDHSNYFDTTSTATTSSYYNLDSLLKTLDASTTKWEEARATAKEYNEKYDDFLCMYGYEMTWSGGPGHTNTFNTYGVVSRNNKALNDKASYAGMLLYNDLMANAEKGLDVDGAEAKTTRDGAEVTGVNATKYIPFDEAGNPVPVVSQFNHPGKTFGNFGNFMGYTARRDDVLNLVEVGNGEGKVGGSSYFPSYEQYDMALAMGWHVGPTNNQDNHKGNWGDSNTCRDVVLTDDFSEIGIYRALDARRIYSTEDQNLEIYYELEANGETYQLGDIAPIDEDNQPDQVTFMLNISEPDNEKIDKVQIIGEGASVLKEFSVDAREFRENYTFNTKDAEGKLLSGYFYIKVVEDDGDIAVTAPIWIQESVPVAAELETSAAVAAQGVEENIIATLTNGSETEPVTLKAWTVTADGVVVKAETDLNKEVAPGSNEVLTVPYTPATTDPSATKTYTITVSFTFEFKGKTQTFQKEITETSYPPELMTYIGLDKGHTNFYVSGDYAGNEGSFIQICAERGIICEYIEAGKMTKENLAKYKAVVLTVPRVSDSVAPTVWTAEELDALKDYADNGGNIINLSKSDRYDYTEPGEGDQFDTYKYASANLSNLVNEAIGAKTRFVRGIVVDNDKKANEAYRINFAGKGLVGSHLFTTGIFASSNGEYQFYNGTGIVTLPGEEANVTTLIAPYPSTWISCYKGYPGHPGNYFTGSSFEPSYEEEGTVMAKKDEFSLVTYEDLAGGGFLVCAGACFISNYDLKVGTPANEQYENYGLVCNILDYIKNGDAAETITPIADVHKGKEEQQFTIRGWVTSNASDYDKDTAFFDCIYIQDETRGINAFPVSGYYYIGEEVEAHGAVTYYCGEIELNLSPDYDGSIKVVSNDLNVLAPKPVTCAQAMSDDNIGNLMQVEGKITEIHETAGVVDKIYVDDGSGEQALLFINSYIQKGSTALADAKVGMMCKGVGIGSRDVDENSGGADGAVGDLDPSLYIKRLRVRARDEILVYEDPCAQYEDVNRKSWYHEGIDYVVKNGIMNGMSPTTFAPNNTLTRGMVVTILYRLAGSPATTGSNPFTDVDLNRYFGTPVLWAVQNEITNGKSATSFDPNGSVTREQLATFIWRFARNQGYDVSARKDLSSFPDQADVSNFAKEPMQWAVAVGLIGGVAVSGVDYLKPRDNTTRAQVATILFRFSKMDVDNLNDLVILYTNDVHCGIDNTEESFGYAGLAAYKTQMEKTHNHVGLVDAGDFIQGEAIGSLSKGESIIKIMNKVGYEAATLGNHEFDYGVDNILKLVKQAAFDIVTCNWIYTGPEGNENAVDLDGYKLVSYGDVKVAYVGITTPESLVKSTPTYFQDAEGNWIYDFCNDKDGTKLYEAVQAEVDAARAEGADYVIALAHLGVDESSAPWRSTDVIRNTEGINVVLDGHSHSVIPSQSVANKKGEMVLLSSTGTKLANIGKLTIFKDGELRTELVSRKDFDGKDADVEAFAEALEAENEELLNQVVVENLPIDLTIANPNRLDASGNPIRAVRYQETNLGDVCADAYVAASGADIAFVNGGGVREDIKAGKVTFNHIIKVHPFGNELVVVEATGQQIVDALEMASRSVKLNEEGLPEGENGGFLQVSGLKYTIYTGTASTVTTDTSGMYSGVTGARRVGDVQVLDKATGEYAPIDLAKTYTLASHNYMLKEGGDGLNMFMKCKILRDGGMLDNEVLINYFNSDLFNTRLAEGLYSQWDGNCARITLSADEADAPVEPQPTEPEEVRYELTTELKDGDKVVIYHPTSSKAVTKILSGKGVEGAQVTVAEGVLTRDAEGKAEVFTVKFTDETSFTLQAADGTYLTTAAKGNGMSMETEPNDYSLWNLKVLDAAEGTVAVYSTNASYNGTNKDQALEYYNDVITTYGWRDNNNAYLFQLYKEVKVEYGYQLKTALADGDKVVIYHPTSSKAVTKILSGKGVEGAQVTVAEGVLTRDAEGKAEVFTVKFTDETSFTLQAADGTYLTTAAKGNGMSMETEPNDYSLWNLKVLDAAEGTVAVYSTNASYNGTNKDQALEYYNDVITTYGWRDNNNAYLFQLYVYGEIKAETEVITTSLEAAIAEAKAVDAAKYTDETVAVLNGALADAEAILAKPGKTQTEVNAAAKALRDAIDGLIEKTVAVPGAYNLTTALKNGDKVIVYHPTSGKAMADTLSDNKVAAVNATVSAGVITAEQAGIYTVEYPEGNTESFYLKTTDGKYLTTGEGGNSMSLENAATDYSLWDLEVKDAAAQTVAIHSTKANHNGNTNQYLEYYNGFTTYGWRDNNSAYIFQIFTLLAEG